MDPNQNLPPVYNQNYYPPGYQGLMPEPPPPNIPKKGLKRYFQEKSILFNVVLLILIPLTFVVIVYRYQIFGLVVKQNFSVQIIDSKTGQPLINATVTIKNKSVKTNNQGLAEITSINVGKTPIKITHNYYQDLNTTTLITFTNDKFHVFGLSNIGTEVKVSVINKIAQTPIASALITVSGSTVATDQNGLATINLPSTKDRLPGDIQAYGYISQQITLSQLIQNNYVMIPSGKVYYLSNTGTSLALIQSNLDGTNKISSVTLSKNANNANTQIIASKDSTYIAIVAPGDNNVPNLYVYNTIKSKLNNVLQNKTGLSINGWSPDNILVFNTLGNQTNDVNAKLQAFNASTNAKPYTLDTVNTIGSSGLSFATEVYSYVNVLQDGNVLFSKNWQGDVNSYANSSSTINSITVKTNVPYNKVTPQQKLNFADSYNTTPQIALVSTTSENLGFINSKTKATNYFIYSNGKSSSSTDSSVKSSVMNPTINSAILLSPDGNSEVWSQTKNGLSTIYTSDSKFKNPVSLGDFDKSFVPYGWWTNGYILLSKNGNELFIIPSTGINNQNKVQKISDFIL